jgi:hypothetical protein
MVEKNQIKGRRPIWYFVGWMLLTIGGLIVIAGILSFFHDLTNTSVVNGTHPDLWWGGFIFLVGVFYIWKHKSVRIDN